MAMMRIRLRRINNAQIRRVDLDSLVARVILCLDGRLHVPKRPPLTRRRRMEWEREPMRPFWEV